MITEDITDEEFDLMPRAKMIIQNHTYHFPTGDAVSMCEVVAFLNTQTKTGPVQMFQIVRGKAGSESVSWTWKPRHCTRSIPLVRDGANRE